MSKLIAAVLFTAAIVATPAQAFDILALRTLGFSPDGRYFAFMQYGPQWEASKLFAETYVIDTSTDRFVPGAPARLSSDMKDDADSDKLGPELKAFLARADKRNTALIGKLKIGTKELPWPKTSRLYAGRDAPSCAKEVEGTGAAFRLTLELGGRSIVLQDDKTVPASRNCVSGYGIAEVQTFDRPDGKVTLAVILGMQSRGFEGQDRMFLAVTRVLNR
jgi:predicted secreted protein